jgi:DNA polymerase I-like protein with 3'-5' exonuclease and polymerase domains
VNDSAASPPDPADVAGAADVADATLQASLAEGGQIACDELVAKTEKDPGAPFAVVSDLAALKQANRQIFENLHRRLKKAGCRVSELDKLINAENGGQSGHEPTQAEILVDLAEAAELFHAPDDVAYADVEVEAGGAVHRETWPIKSRGFRRWLENLYFAETRGAPNSEAMRAALSVIEAQAHHGAPVREVHTRIGAHAGKLYLDLCDETWRAVEIDKVGWRIVALPAARFRRSPDMRALPEPVRGGSINELRPLLNISGDASGDDDFILAIAFELACLRGRGPHPVMSVGGEQGTAKSTRSALLRSVIDPGRPALRSLPRSERDLFISARNRHVLAFDNVSGLPQWLSDAFCRVSSGSGFGTRQLYSDDEEALFDGARPLILNGIEEVVERPDLAERAVFSVCEPIAESARKSEDEMNAAFDAVHASVLGALLDAVSTGLRNAPNLKTTVLPRMADFAKWSIACEPALWGAGEFLRAYRANIQGAVESVLEASPVAVAVRTLMDQLAQDKRTQWTGTASALLAELVLLVSDKVAKEKTWPTNGRALSGHLRRAASFLRRVGIDVAFATGGATKTRWITITAVFSPGPSNGRKSAPFAPAPPAPEAASNNINDLGSGTAGAKDANLHLKTAAERKSPPIVFEVDGVEVVVCQTTDQAEACIQEIVADAGGKPVALDLETCPIQSERERLKTLKAARTAVNAEAIAFRKAAKKAKTPQAEIDAVTAAASAKLKLLDYQIGYCASAGLDPWRATARTAQIYGGGRRAAVIDLSKTGCQVLAFLNGVDAVFHGAPFDLSFLDRLGITLGRVQDTQQAARLTIGPSKCSFAAAVKHYLKATLDKELQASDWSVYDLSETQLTYAARDVIWLWRLRKPLFAAIGPQVSAYRIQAAAAPALARMNNAGIMLDLDAHAGAMQAFAEADTAASAAYREACVEIGKPELAAKLPKTARDVAAFLQALLTKAELDGWRRTKKTGALSTAVPALWQAIHYPPIPPLIELSKLNGLRSSFGELLRFRVNPVSGRVHPHYTLSGAATGRSTTIEPNIQGTPRDLRIRALFRAADGYVLYASDYHCMELRAGGYFFEDPALMAVFERGDDPHTLTASHVSGKPLEEITDEERSKAKNANFGIIYGIGAASLAWQVWKNYHRRISLAEAENLLAVFERLYPAMIANRRAYAQACQTKGRIIIGPEWREGRGRIVPLERLPPDQSPLTCAYSYPIQGICADVCMKAIADVDRRLRDQAIDGRLVGWIHDELLVEAREANAEQVTLLLKDAMERAFIDIFPGATLNKLVEVKAGRTWAETKDKKKPAAESEAPQAKEQEDLKC